MTEGTLTGTTVALQDVGSEWVRLNIQWKEAEPQDDQYNLWWIAEYTTAVEGATNAPMQPFPRVAGGPFAAKRIAGQTARELLDEYAGHTTLVDATGLVVYFLVARAVLQL